MKLHYLSFALIFLAACNSGQTPSTTSTSTSNKQTAGTFIQPPLKQVVPAIQVFSFENATGFVKKTTRQSIISIPANAFVLEDGTPVKGQLDVSFQEIFNPAEIILSGIPMNVQNKGQTVPFISDGMFSIAASSQGKKARLAEGKNISVSVPSVKKDTDFDFWYFNDTKGEWENTGDRLTTYTPGQVLEKSSAINPEQTLAFQQSLAPAGDPTKPIAKPLTKETTSQQLKKPLPPVKHNPNDFVFNIAASYKDYPELASFKNVLWKPVLDLNSQERVALKNGMEKFGANVSLTCKDQDLQVYAISYGSKTIEAQPVFIGSDKKKAAANYQARMQAYTETLKAEESAKKQAEKASEEYAKNYNMFAVNKMGVYNCDKFYSYAGQKDNYTFRCDKEPVKQHVFAILKNNQGVIGLTSGYMQGDYYNLPSREILGFIYTNPQGTLSYAVQDEMKLGDVNDIDLTIYRKPVKGPETLEEIIKSF